MRSSAAWLLLAVVAVLNQPPSFAAEPVAKRESDLLGRRIDAFTLHDFRGKSHALSDYDDQQAVVLCFLGTECPLAKLYAPRLEKLSEQFSTRGVAFLGI